jgi:hypothetical protein
LSCIWIYHTFHPSLSVTLLCNSFPTPQSHSLYSWHH